uniref:Uncharacterized protein LOC114333896 n=1 Tax=Diabrotica virgifera virgifera TaxID=50390 RepID=A0A6P7FTD6_DIAVI
MKSIIFGIVGLLYFMYCTEEGSALNCYGCHAKVGNGSSCETGKNISSTLSHTCTTPQDRTKTLACITLLTNTTIYRYCGYNNTCNLNETIKTTGFKWCKSCTTNLCNTQSSSVSIIAPTILTPMIIVTVVLSYF